MRRIMLLIGGLALMPGCASAQLTKADAVIGVSAFETAARTAHATINQDTGLPWLSAQDETLIVAFCEAALGAIQAGTGTVDGIIVPGHDWRRAVAAAWARFKLTYIVDPANTMLLAVFAALNLLFAPYGG
jgi:hypothetical protein